MVERTGRIEGARVHLEISTANGRAINADRTTNSLGFARSGGILSTATMGIGTCTVVGTATKLGFNTGSNTTTFEVTLDQLASKP